MLPRAAGCLRGAAPLALISVLLLAATAYPALAAAASGSATSTTGSGSIWSTHPADVAAINRGLQVRSACKAADPPVQPPLSK